MSALRPLPPRPNLEYERKAAKALLRGLRAGDPDAVARMRECHPRVELSDAAAIRLADAQLVIAREYGFTSWPRLVDYFDGVERQRHAHRQPAFEREFYEALVPGWLVAHRDRRLQIGRARCDSRWRARTASRVGTCCSSAPRPCAVGSGMDGS